ncbi:MAG: carboxypeptidase regulatory-like domain-containing protein [Pyrinomonadaceae bacterium]
MNSENNKQNMAPVVTLLALTLFGVIATFAQTPTLRDNGKIAFTSDRDGNREIYVMEPDGSEQTRITDNSVDDDHPAWSPDGRKIAFVSQRASGETAVFLMNADGSGRTEITPITVQGYSVNKLISWSPDGRQLVISDQQRNGNVFTLILDIVDVDGSNRRFLTSGYQPAWSPDGSKILFVAPPMLSTIRPDGTESRFLYALPFGGIRGYPDWSPDGSRIAFIGGDNANTDMFVISSDGSRLLVAVNECGGLSPQGCGFINSLAWSPDGTKIVYGAFGYLYVVDQNGNDRTAVAFDGGNWNPSWQSLASEVSISGRVTTPGGQGLRNAVVSMTDSQGVRRMATTSSFGLYSFSDIPPGQSYTISVSSRRYRFAPRTLVIDNDLTGIDFTGLE